MLPEAISLDAILMASAGIVAYKVLNKEKEGIDYTIETTKMKQ